MLKFFCSAGNLFPAKAHKKIKKKVIVTSMMNEKLAILTLFCMLNVPLTLSIDFVKKKLMFLAFAGKYSYSLFNRTLSMRVNSLENKFYILVEVIRIYKTFSYCFVLSICFSYLLKDRLICVMMYLVNSFYIALSLRVKVR